ncbi:MAG: hypothetical protein Q9208_001475 [Pyrenodesmia sp. 3 TL-2023]
MAQLASLTPQQRQILLDGPGLPPPPGVIPQFDHPPDLKYLSMAVETTGFLLATIALCIRMYTRILIIRRVSWGPDFTLVVGWLAYAALFATSRAALLSGGLTVGVHQWDVRLKDVWEYFYYFYIGALLYGPAVVFIRLSIILQYLQIFVPNKEPFKMYLTAQVLIWVNAVFYIICTFLMLFGTSPRKKAWDPLVEGGSGIDLLALHVAGSVVVVASDLGALILPQISVWRLQMTRRKKLQISALFLVGAFACATSIIRLGYSIMTYTHMDKIYYAWVEGEWVLPELASGVIVACVPVFPKFFGSLGQTWVFSRLSSTLQSLLHRSSRLGSKRGADEASLPHHVTLKPLTGNGIGWPKNYEELRDEHRGQGTFILREEAMLWIADKDTGITRSVDIHTTTESSSEMDAGSRDKDTLWQGKTAYDMGVRV